MKKANFDDLKAMVDVHNNKKLYTLCGSLCSGPHKNPEKVSEYHEKMVEAIRNN